MATTSSAWSATRLPLPLDRPQPRHTGHRLLSVVGQLNAFVRGEARPDLPGPARAVADPASPAEGDARRRAEIARITGPVAAGSHPAPAPPVDKRSAVAHYRALAEQVARERRCAGGGGLDVRGVRDA